MNDTSLPKILNTREDIIDLLPKNISIAEIGVFKGDFSKILFDKLSPSKLFLVDIFTGHMGSGDKNGENFEFINLGDSFNNLVDFFKNEPSVEIIKSYSHDFLSKLENESIDAVYIDADHCYEAVKTDLNLSFAKVKTGGFIMGHDYCSNSFPSVVQAVNEFCKTFNQRISIITKDGCPSFLIIKQ